MTPEVVSLHIRERSPWEIYDLAVVFCRQYMVALLVITSLTTAPMIFLMRPLFTDTYVEDRFLSLMTWSFLMFCAAPFLSAPLTVFLGDALFATKPGVVRSLIVVLRRLPILILTQFFCRVLTAALFPLVLFLYPPTLNEVTLLEGSGVWASIRRAGRLRSHDEFRYLHLILAGVILVAGGAGAVAALSATRDVLLSETPSLDQILLDFHPAESVVPWLVLPLLLTYLTVVRFLTYIDLRTRLEGWEVEIEIRRAAARLESGGRE